MSVVFPPLYAIIDPTLLQTSEMSFAESMVEAGVQLLQYRDKRASTRQLFEMSNLLSRRLSNRARGDMRPVRFIVNDRADIALLVAAGGVHVGQTDLGVEQSRAILGREPWIGVSTHTLEQVEAADRTSADYVAFGPVFATATKEQADPVVGLRLLAQARSRTSKPLVAIGGITLERARDTYLAGADSLAVARDILKARDPGAQARAFLKEAAGVERPERGPRLV
jgi:thiamine-phosphate pyrophosphorylase